MEPNVKEFVNSLLKTQITDNLTLNDKENKLNHQSGLICFLQGYCLETGFQVQPNLNNALNHYHYGLRYFMDPLCALQLEQYYTKTKKKNLAIFCKIIYYLLLELIYDLKHSIKKVEIINYEESLIQIAPTTDLPLNQMSNFLKALFTLKESGQQTNYDQLLKAFSEMGTKIHAYPIMLRQFTYQTNNPNKCPDQVQSTIIFNLGTHTQVGKCLFNISLHGMSENSHLNAIRSIIFELSFLHRPDPYPEVVEQLYLRQTQSVLHRILLIRKHAKAKKSYDIQEEEFKFIDQSKTPISFYMIGKRQLDKQKVCHLCKAKELLKNPWPQDPFVTFVYLFYKAKLELHHQNHDGYTKLIDNNLFEDCKLYYDRNYQIFKQVRTLQFYSIRSRVDKQRDKITYKNKQIQQMFDQKRLQILEQSRISFHTLQQSQISLRKSYFNQSPSKIDNIKQTQSIYVENRYNQLDRTIKGPSILQNTEQQYQQFESRFIELENKIRFNKLNLIKSDDINDIQFISKSNRDGLISIGKYHGQNLFIKTLAYMNYEQINQYFKQVKKYVTLEHQNLRTVIGYNIEDLQEIDLSGHIRILIYKYEYNLRTFLNKNQISTKEKWHMAIQIIDAIYYLHQHDITFCNLHPNNILIESENFIPILIDYDLPFDKDYLDNKYTHKSIIEEDMPLFTEKQDIYSIGCLLLYLFFGCEFQFKNIMHSTSVSLEMFQTLNPYQSSKVEFQLQPGSEALEERVRLIIQKCLDGDIELLDLLQQFYDHA